MSVFGTNTQPDAVRYRHADPGAHVHTKADADTVFHSHPFAADDHPFDLERAHPATDPARDVDGADRGQPAG